MDCGVNADMTSSSKMAMRVQDHTKIANKNVLLRTCRPLCCYSDIAYCKTTSVFDSMFLYRTKRHSSPQQPSPGANGGEKKRTKWQFASHLQLFIVPWADSFNLHDIPNPYGG